MTTASPRPVWRRAQVPAAVLGVVLLVAAAVWSLSAARSLTADPTGVAVGSGVAHPLSPPPTECHMPREIPAPRPPTTREFDGPR